MSSKGTDNFSKAFGIRARYEMWDELDYELDNDGTVSRHSVTGQADYDTFAGYALFEVYYALRQPDRESRPCKGEVLYRTKDQEGLLGRVDKYNEYAKEFVAASPTELFYRAFPEYDPCTDRIKGALAEVGDRVISSWCEVDIANVWHDMYLEHKAGVDTHFDNLTQDVWDRIVDRVDKVLNFNEDYFESAWQSIRLAIEKTIEEGVLKDLCGQDGSSLHKQAAHCANVRTNEEV
jgi:hypothetical protein